MYFPPAILYFKCLVPRDINTGSYIRDSVVSAFDLLQHTTYRVEARIS